jgi:hypothetical protein
MKIKKRVFSFVILALFLTGVTSCGGDDSKKGKVKLTVKKVG